MFDALLYNLRSQGVDVGLGEWLIFLQGIEKELVTDLDGLYRYGRAVLARSEAHFDAWDLCFQATFDGVELPPEIKDELAEWLKNARSSTATERTVYDMELDELRRQFYERLKEQSSRHDGGSHWVGTGGTSPFGNGGQAEGGIQIGGGGNRSALWVAGERRWKNYRADQTLGIRDFKVALRALRSLVREGQLELDLDGTIDRTCANAGDVELVWQKARRNRIHLVLIMDSGGSMSPHARVVEQLFTAAKELDGFKSFQALYFHNAPYGWLYTDFETMAREPIEDLLRSWTPAHRVVFVGDASMAPYELFGSMGGDGYGAGRRSRENPSGLQWLQRIRRRCPSSIWLNPDPERWWNHPTVQAIGSVFEMYPMSLSGLREGIRELRKGP
jgi:uncharacterized protein with von Willebrand factor type A (vWA) domain